MTKLVLTLGLATASIFGLRTRIATAISDLPEAPAATISAGPEGVWLVILLPVALAIYTAATVLSVYKPWGTTRRGARDRGPV